MSYPQYTQLNLPSIATDILKQWHSSKTFARSVAQNAKGKRFNVYEGPPSANGKPGIHHVLSRTLKDIFCRYKTMQGYYVPRKAGWDTHGLPVELQAEKELGITKEAIGKSITIADYNAYCRTIVLRFQKEWNELTEKIGYWVDLENPYLTCDNDYITTVWGILKGLYEKKLLYKGYSIQPYSPAAGTGLSAHELNQPNCYKIVKDLTIVAQFPWAREPNTYFLAWTTTPWTLPANTALALNPHITYVKVETFNRYTHQRILVILAEKALERYFDADHEGAPMEPTHNSQDPLPWRIVQKYQGSDLTGISYTQLMPYIQPNKRAFYTIPADFVTTEDGTGIVHIAPTFGEDDFQIAQQHHIPSITVTRAEEEVPIVDKQGRFVAEITDFAHQYVKEDYATDTTEKRLSVDIQIAQKLKKENKAFLTTTYNHSYPHCWRTDKPILYYPLDAWFIKTTAKKKALVAHNQQINWQPSSTGTKRFQHWLENLVDWNISRPRFWGTPLPIWRTPDGTEEKCIGSFEELQREVKKAIDAGIMTKPLVQDEDLDLHRPFVDHIVLISDQGEKMYRENDVIDVWLDSGAMPYAATPDLPLHTYGEKTPPIHFPADFIAEGVDQTRGWFFTLHTLAVMLFDKPAYKNVLSCGLVLDKQGSKMSKRLGNTIDPFQLIDKVGPDAIRWYMLSNTNPWENLKFDIEGIEEIRKKFFGTLYNTYQFFALYANIDQYEPPEDYPTLSTCTQADRWILSRLQGLIAKVKEAYDTYDPTPATRAIQHFIIEELSNWYVRLNRKRFWVSEATEDKRVAYHTLHVCLSTVAQLAAPIAPFYMDHLYQDLHQHKHTSVHLTPFPQVKDEYKAPSLEAPMDKAQKISSLIHALRKKHKLKVRQPLQKILIPIASQEEKAQIVTVENLILAEVNVKSIVYIDDTQAIVHKRARPNFQVAGKKYGHRIKSLTRALAAMSQEAIHALEKNGFCQLSLDGESVKVLREDILLTANDLPGWAVATEDTLTVALDLEVTPALRAEGWVREAINKIQHLRKAEAFAVEDKIHLRLSTPAEILKKAIQTHANYLSGEVQAVTLSWEDDVSSHAKTDFDINGHLLSVSLTKNS